MIEIKPKIAIHPSSQVIPILSALDNLSLTCEAKGATAYYWERQDGSIPSGATGVNSETLTIANLTPEDAGNYRCVVSNDSDEGFSNYAEITVIG